MQLSACILRQYEDLLILTLACTLDIAPKSEVLVLLSVKLLLLDSLLRSQAVPYTPGSDEKLCHLPMFVRGGCIDHGRECLPISVLIDDSSGAEQQFGNFCIT